MNSKNTTSPNSSTGSALPSAPSRNSNKSSTKSMPTAIDPIDPGRVLADIHRFKETIARAIATEDELEQSRRARHLKLSREISAREQTDLEALDARLAELNYQHEL